MECKKLRTLSKVSLVISVLPLATLIPVFLKLTLPGGVSTAWAGVNIACVVAGLILSIICVDGRHCCPGIIFNFHAVSEECLWSFSRKDQLFLLLE